MNLNRDAINVILNVWGPTINFLNYFIGINQ